MASPAIEDHDTGDEDRSGSVACWCVPWCGLPICACGEDHGGILGRCRDCDIAYMLDSMQCSACRRMRYRTEPLFGNLGEYLWGARCVCADPLPPTLA